MSLTSWKYLIYPSLVS